MRYLTLLAVLLLASTVQAQTVTYTDADGVATSTIPVPLDGRCTFRIQMPDLVPLMLPTQAVLVTDDAGQMVPGCYPMGNGQTILVTSELLVATAPIVALTGRSYTEMDCTGAASIASNPILVEFVPEVSTLLAPLAP